MAALLESFCALQVGGRRRMNLGGVGGIGTSGHPWGATKHTRCFTPSLSKNSLFSPTSDDVGICWAIIIDPQKRRPSSRRLSSSRPQSMPLLIPAQLRQHRIMVSENTPRDPTVRDDSGFSRCTLEKSVFNRASSAFSSDP